MKELEETIVPITVTLPIHLVRQLKDTCPQRGDRSKLMRKIVGEYFERISA